MPIYEYKCQSCKRIFEKFQAVTDAVTGECIYCGSPAKRIISSSVGIVFKGSGFYVTDYKKKESKSEKSESKSEEKSK